MSYILEALRKAERERQTARAPTLGAAHGDPDTSRRRGWLWPWAVVVALLLGAVGTYLAWITDRPGPIEQAASGVPKPPAVETKPSSASAPVPAAPAPSFARAPEREARARLRAPPLTAAPPPGEVELASPPASPASIVRETRPAPAPPAARVETEPRPVAPAPRPGGSGETLRPGQIPEGHATPPPGLGGSAPSEARPSASPPVPAAVPGGSTLSAPAEPAPQFTLDVLVYSDAPAERLVFINGRKYVEGQAVDGQTIVEQITPDGVVLQHAERRIVLSPKLNPYTRPRSP